jgi:hypothetical protein
VAGKAATGTTTLLKAAVASVAVATVAVAAAAAVGPDDDVCLRDEPSSKLRLAFVL